jgi:hypothetical protein
MGMSIGHSFGWGAGAFAHCPAKFVTPQIPAKLSAQQGIPVTPSTGPHMFCPQPTLPMGMGDDAVVVGIGPASLWFFLPPLPFVWLLFWPELPESLPQAIGQRLANNVATAIPRITFAMFIALSCPSRSSVRNARRRAIRITAGEIRLPRGL